MGLVAASPHTTQTLLFSLWILLEHFILLEHTFFSTICEFVGITVQLLKSFSRTMAPIYPQTNEAQRWHWELIKEGEEERDLPE